MDWGLVLGFLAGGLAVLQGVQGAWSVGGSMAVLLVVLGGGLAASLMVLPLGAWVRLPAVFAAALRKNPTGKSALVRRLVALADKARREGILALEGALGRGDSSDLKLAMLLIVDGTEPKTVQDILETDLHSTQARHRQQQQWMRGLGWNCLLFGGVGAALAAPEAGLGAAALPLLCGTLAGGLVVWPLGRRLAEKAAAEALERRIIIEGALGMQRGDNPRIIEHKLAMFLAPEQRPTAPPQGKLPATKPPPAVDQGKNSQLKQMAQEDFEALRGQLQEADWVAAEFSRILAKLSLDEVKRVEYQGTVVRIAEDNAALAWLLQTVVSTAGLDQLGEWSPKIAEWMRRAGVWLRFEDCAGLSDRDIQVMLRQVDQKDLVLALKGSNPGVQERIFANMSERVQTFIREEMEFLGEVDPEVVGQVRQKISGLMIRLQLEDKIGVGVS